MLIAKEHKYRAGGVMREDDCAADDARMKTKRKDMSFAEFMRVKLDELRAQSESAVTRDSTDSEAQAKDLSCDE